MLKKILQRIGLLSRDETDFPFDLISIEKKINYIFDNKLIILQALTHRSYLSLSQDNFSESNERLEFLGDAVLDLIVTEYLFRNFGSENEGILSQKKSVLVSRKALGKLADEMDLGQYLLIDKGEEKTGGRNRLSNLANLFEAVLGAIYIDRGFIAAEKFVHRFLISRQEQILAAKTYFNYKSALLEYSQAQGWGLPKYRVIEESGPDHDKRFVISVEAAGKWNAQGEGKSKKNAEQRAAKGVLKKLKESS
jgi:ribonuclease-3